jgi:hypothetical protein
MKSVAAQIVFRYGPQDSATGVTRTTAKRLASYCKPGRVGANLLD